MRLKPRRYTKRSFTKVVDSMIYDKNIHGRDWDYIAIIGHIEKLLSKENMDIDFDKLKFSVGDNSTAINKYLNSLIKDIDPNVLKRTFVNFGYNAMVKGTKSIHHLRKVQKANIPWLIFIDPTTECNLHCSGCWSSSYEYKT